MHVVALVVVFGLLWLMADCLLVAGWIASARLLRGRQRARGLASAVTVPGDDVIGARPRVAAHRRDRAA